MHTIAAGALEHRGQRRADAPERAEVGVDRHVVLEHGVRQVLDVAGVDHPGARHQHVDRAVALDRRGDPARLRAVRHVGGCMWRAWAPFGCSARPRQVAVVDRDHRDLRAERLQAEDERQLDAARAAGDDHVPVAQVGRPAHHAYHDEDDREAQHADDDPGVHQATAVEREHPVLAK